MLYKCNVHIYDFFFVSMLFVFRKVTSQPFSRIPGNRSFRYIVCSVEVLVKGASQQLPEVRDALGSAPLEQLTLKQTIHVPTLQTGGRDHFFCVCGFGSYLIHTSSFFFLYVKM